MDAALAKTKVVILAGGLGTRLSEETETKPKPMVEIGDRPILWHIMKHFGHYGAEEFLVALGYKGEVIKRYFLDYYSLDGSMTLDLKTGKASHQDKTCEPWRIHFAETGFATLTGGRVKRLAASLRGGTFIVTYGDGVADVDLDALLAFHRQQGKLGTVTAVRPPARFGGLSLDGDLVAEFSEKPQAGEGWINGGFLVFEPAVLDLLAGDDSILEIHALERLAKDGQLAAFRHPGFWQCMDTLRDKRQLQAMWNEGRAPWRVWA